MICLEKFYEEYGFSRTLLAECIKVSVSTLRKYECSNTDHMRKSTIDKIETGVGRMKELNLHVDYLHFGKGCVLYWDDPERRITKNDWVTTAGIVQHLIGVA